MDRSVAVILSGVLLCFTLIACHGTAAPMLPSSQMAPPYQPALAMMPGARPNSAPWAGKIKHIIIIFQENRTTDNLFNGYPGANTQSWGLDQNGNHIPLAQV